MMNKSEFTPGPWKVMSNNRMDMFSWMVYNDDFSNWPIAVEMKKEDAYLMAATPDMYEACKAMMDALNKLPGGLPDSTFTEPYFAMREALAKAEGLRIFR